jgi:DinB family protein
MRKNMKELDEYRVHLIEKLVASAEAFQAACLAVKDPFAPLEAGGWNVHQLAKHTRDIDRLAYGLRVRRTLEENNPAFSNFDGETYMREHYSAGETLPTMLDGFVTSIRSLADLLRTLPVPAWSRVSHHEKLGSGITLQLWVERSLAHIEEHLATVQKAQ